MTNASAKDRILKALSDHVCEPVAPEQRLTEDLRFDSLSYTALALDLEDAFEVRIESEDAEQWKTVQDIIDFLTPKIGQ